MIPIAMQAMQTIWSADICSPKMITPAIVVPTIPIPVQMAYAVLSGRCFSAIARKTKLAAMPATVMTDGQNCVKLWDIFRPTAQVTSKMPAINKNNHDIFFSSQKQKGTP